MEKLLGERKLIRKGSAYKRDLAVAEAKLRLDAKDLYRYYLPVLKY